MSADHQCSLSADAERTFIFVSHTRNGFSFQRRRWRYTRSTARNMNFTSILTTCRLCVHRIWPIEPLIQGLGMRSFSCSFQLRDTTTSRACRAMGQGFGSAASADYFDLTSRISVRHRPPESGSFDRSTLELQLRRSSSPFCAIARSSTLR